MGTSCRNCKLSMRNCLFFIINTLKINFYRKFRDPLQIFELFFKSKLHVTIIFFHAEIKVSNSSSISKTNFSRARCVLFLIFLLQSGTSLSLSLFCFAHSLAVTTCKKCGCRLSHFTRENGVQKQSQLCLFIFTFLQFDFIQFC